MAGAKLDSKWVFEAVAPTENTSAEYRNVAAKDGFETTFEGVSTLYELFQRSVKKYANNPCLGVREKDAEGKAGAYKFMTYAEVGEKTNYMATYLRTAASLAPHGRCGVLGANCPEWMIAMQANNCLGAYTVPLYDTLGADAVEYILNHAECTVVIAEDKKFAGVLEALPKAPNVTTVMYWGTLSEETLASPALKGKTVISFGDAIEAGKSAGGAGFDHQPPKPQDFTTIMYTSGTTGNPKGVLLKHSAVLASVIGVFRYLESLGIHFTDKDSYISYLPLAHIFDRACEEFMLLIGGSIGYWQGDVKLLVADIGVLKPTMFAGVPRIYDRIYQVVMGSVKEGSFVKRMLFEWGFNHKLKYLDAGLPHDKASPFFDKLIFGKVKQKLGGNVRVCISGAAPLARHVENFLRVAMCCPMVQGYGLTETCAASTIAIPDDPRFVGTVGCPLTSIGVRLESVPDMKYDSHANPPRGEICFKGPTLFSGYYKQQDITDEVMDKDGYFHTGDVGEVTPEGSIRIIDRKKNIFKLAQGEYVAVEKVEEVYSKCSILDQLWVYGDSFQTFLVAVVVPNEKAIMTWAKANGVSGDYAEVCKAPATNQYILDDFNKVAKAGKLKGFEIVKKLFVESTPFGVDNDLLTPTFKKKRPQLKDYYLSQIDKMYGK